MNVPGFPKVGRENSGSNLWQAFVKIKSFYVGLDIIKKVMYILNIIQKELNL